MKTFNCILEHSFWRCVCHGESWRHHQYVELFQQLQKFSRNLPSLNSMLHFLLCEKLTTFQCMSQFTNWNYATTNYANTFCVQQLGIKTMEMNRDDYFLRHLWNNIENIEIAADFFLFSQNKKDFWSSINDKTRNICSQHSPGHLIFRIATRQKRRQPDYQPSPQSKRGFAILIGRRKVGPSIASSTHHTSFSLWSLGRKKCSELYVVWRNSAIVATWED